MPTPHDTLADALGEIAHRTLRASADGNRQAVAAGMACLLACAREARAMGREMPGAGGVA